MKKEMIPLVKATGHGRIYRSVAALLLCAAILISLARCGNNRDQVKLADTIGQIQGLEDYAPASAAAEAFSKEVTYKVGKISWDGDTGTAKVQVITPDLQKIISDSIEDAIKTCGTEDYDRLLTQVKQNVQDALESGKYPKLKYKVKMEVRKTEDGYTLVSNEEFQRIITGNVGKIFLEAVLEVLENENKK